MQDAGRPLSLQDAGRIAQALGAGPFAPAEHQFANLWLFRARHRYRIVEDPIPYVRGVTYDGMVHALPLAKLGAVAMHALAAGGVDCLYPLGDDAAPHADMFNLTATYDPADSDYWYEGSAMASLNHAKSRRGQARRFATDQAPDWQDWTPSLAAEALAILDGWARDVDRPIERTDTSECREAIAMSHALGLEGGVVRTGAGEPVAFLLASRAGDARVVHFAKGRRSHSDAYPWMFATYAARSGATWLNFEQDLGNPGLARSKRAYAPVRIQPKFRIGLAELR